MVFDTMIIAYALLGTTAFSEPCRDILSAHEGEVWVPDLFRAKFANVLWQHVRGKFLQVEAAVSMLHHADALVAREFSSAGLWVRALELAVEHAHPVYDMIFVALAESTSTQLVTYDKKILRKLLDRAFKPNSRQTR